MPTREVILKTAAGRYHMAGVAEDGSLLTREGCNLDDVAGDLERLEAVPEDAPVETLCGNCFTAPLGLPE